MAEAILGKARWIEARLNEMPRYLAFLYNLLIDPKLPDDYKEQAFATLGYVLDGGDIIPQDDQLLAGIDECAFAFRCLAELVGRLPPAMLAVYEEVLFTQGIPLRDRVREAPEQLGSFFFAVAALYKERVKKRSVEYKSSIKTGQIVKGLQAFLQFFKPLKWTPEHLQRVDGFLQSFQLGAPKPAAAPKPA